ncbi:MAG: SulP family inorganic anion transporter, partial [Ideonella sp.]|nr:SulP family inorganic anion transporter [Ideonella sp.]
MGTGVGATVRNLSGGMMDALTALAIVLTLGLLAFSSLGASAASVGIPAAMAGVVVGGLVFAALAGGAVPTAGPTSATTLIMASLVATLVADPELRVREPGGLAALLALCGAMVVLAGVFQILFAAAGAHRLARRVPQPVLAGFMNGVALLILLAQVPPLLGLPPVSKWSVLDETVPVQPLAAVLGGLTALVFWASARWRPRWPAPLLGLAVGALAYWAMEALSVGVSLGPVVGTLRESYPWPDTLLPFVDEAARELLARHAPAIVTTALAVAVIGALESLLTAVAIDQLAHTRHDSRRELMALGAANIGSGLVGGLPMVLTRARAVVLLDRGLRGRAPAVWSAAMFLALQAFGTGLIALLPKAVLAGIMLVIAAALVDRWTRQLFGRWRAGDRSPELRVSLGVVLAVCAITWLAGFPAAIVAGTLLSLALFVRGMSRSLVRSRRTAVDQPSRRVYAPAQEERLATLRRRILILELEGALFFGSVERLAAEADALPADVRILVLDLRRLTMIDESGAVLLEQLTRRLPQRGTRLMLAGVNGGSGHAASLARFAAFPAGAQVDWHA